MRNFVHIARRGATLLMVLVAFLTTVPAPAGAYHRDRQRELERLIEQKRDAIRRAEAQERDLLSEIQASDERRDSLERQLESIQDELDDALAKLALVEARLEKVSAELRVATAELELTLAKLDEQSELLQMRVQHLYMDSAATLAASLEAAKDLNDFMVASQYQASVVQSNMAVVDEIEATKLAIESKRAEIETKKAALEADRKEADTEADRIAAIRAKQQAARADVQREINYRSYLLDQVRDKKAAYKRALDSYVRESESIASFLRGAQSGQNVIQGRGGWLKWPLSGRITSPYGWRTHPVYGYRSFHTGIDIGGNPSGTPVKAARGGTVLYTGYKGAYGLIVLIDHGSSVATLYAHLSRTYVRSGERVGSLETVGAVGSTGWSTGPHLHFEVRVNGEHSNPMSWL